MSGPQSYYTHRRGLRKTSINLHALLFTFLRAQRFLKVVKSGSKLAKSRVKLTKTGVKPSETWVKLTKTEQNRGGLGIGDFEVKSQGDVVGEYEIGLVGVACRVLAVWR